MIPRGMVMRLALGGLLLGVSAVWGWTFVVVKNAVAAYGVVAFLALRFAIASAVMAPLSLRRMSRRTLRTGLAIGCVLTLAYLFQTLGVNRTTPTNCGLITGLFVLFAPVFDRVLYGLRIRRLMWAAVAASLAGMALLVGQGEWRSGDLLTVVAAVMYGLHLSLLSRHSPGHDSAALALGQMLTVAVVMGAAARLSGKLTWPSPSVWWALGITGVLASAAAFYVQTFVQARLSAVRTGIILTMEPLFAAVFGYALAGDRLTGVQVLGGAIMLGAMLAAQFIPPAKGEANGASRASQAGPPAAA